MINYIRDIERIVTSGDVCWVDKDAGGVFFVFVNVDDLLPQVDSWDLMSLNKHAILI